ncbi:unnamed protein product [Clonostachys rhizophaga]|uniref:Aromatic amino acid beta-eliminating lyase/threonine aldolase domain-containing protein n=1 Tax=Clonostachys rhizophaga TaxID=160324 RepID=A0A9N9VBV1_9HYPO|nr:unnamed protein product [Clonostachys rhizophaga]
MQLGHSRPAAQFSTELREKVTRSIAKASHDFRSDVVTVPTEDMLQAILHASVGDDVYDIEGDASTNALEARVLELTGKEAALWAVSGTQANQLGLRTHLNQPPHSVLLDHRAHVHCSEVGALPLLSQASVTMVVPHNGLHLTLEDVKGRIIPQGNIHATPTRVVCLENTLSGVILPLRDAEAISQYVRSLPVPQGQQAIAMHLDGARLFDAVVAEGVDVKAYVACFDSVSICLSKGLGAPIGSILLGSKDFISRARIFRKMFGGGTRQPGMMTAAAHAALNHTIPRLPLVHSMARETFQRLQAIGYTASLPVQTNMILLDLPKAGISPDAFIGYCRQAGLQVTYSGRLVFHHQTSTEATNKLVNALQRLMEDKNRGRIEDCVAVPSAGHC